LVPSAFITQISRLSPTSRVSAIWVRLCDHCGRVSPPVSTIVVRGAEPGVSREIPDFRFHGCPL